MHDAIVASTTRLFNEIGEACRNYSQTVDPLLGFLTSLVINVGNTNQYDGPVDEPVIVIDGNGNATPLNTGESIGASPDGKWQEVKDKNKNPTGTRIDNGHPKTHDDPRAQNPHAHVPGVTNPDGTPWLPLK